GNRTDLAGFVAVKRPPREPTERADHLVRLRPRPETLYVSQGRTVLATARDGFVAEGEEHGLFFHQTRLLSRYGYLIDGHPPHPVALSNVEQHSWLGYYIALPPGTRLGDPDHGSGHLEEVSQQTLELLLARQVGAGMHEDVDLTNFTQRPTWFRLELVLDADFADQGETRVERLQTGRLERAWRKGEDAWELAFDYRAEHAFDHRGERGIARLHRGLVVRVMNAGSAPSAREGGISFKVDLPPQGRWHACIDFMPVLEGDRLEPAYRCRSFAGASAEQDQRRDVFLKESTDFDLPETHTLASVVAGALDQAKRDLMALRLDDLDVGDDAWTMAAGLPMYVALFGRDTLSAAWQAAPLSPEMMRGTLAVLARWQGTEVNDWRDEQPGKMLHEAHTGPLAMLNFNPRQRYYGSITTSGFYPVVVSELWHWTGEKDLVRAFLEPAFKALRWLDEHALRRPDGFYEYQSRSTLGTKHQAWKDSADAMVYEDGSQAEPPIATCEEQAFVYLAKLHLSELLWWLDEKETAKRLFHEAGELRKRFNEAYWMEQEGFFAMALDKDRRPLRSIASNAGHCLAAGIVDKQVVGRTADRLLAEDLFTGWGVRTLSARHPSYNPYSYHRGSVWPVEHGSFAIGFMRYGLHDHLERLCRAQFEAARLFDFYRLPEVFTGHPRDADHPFPAVYPKANSPQAWSASAVISFVQAMLGLYPYAPLDLLLVDPHLPEWLPEITLRNLRVGKAQADIRFYKKEDGNSGYDVLEVRGRLRVLRQPSPWSLTASFGERLKDALASLVPG
ncbi:MAG TPA: glycogen debranching N-terminal domain-containing protein, partial [Vicinamibacteria bacterium]